MRAPSSATPLKSWRTSMPFSLRTLLIASCMTATGATLTSIAMAVPIVSVPATSVSSPQPLGTSVTITASATDTDPGTLSYRFEIGASNSTTLNMVRDYSVDPTFVFTPELYEGKYQFVVFARNNSTGNIGTNLISAFNFTTLVTGGVPVVTSTVNPL